MAKSLAALPRVLRKPFRTTSFVFSGDTKKVAYEGALTGVPLIPIQGLTAIVSTVAALIGTLLFLQARWTAAIVVTVAITQLWRAFSETLRADYRGRTRISAYQVMSLSLLPYTAALLLLLPSANVNLPDLVAGASSLIGGLPLLMIELLWVTIFLYLGRSSVTAARLSFHVVRERV